jgi:hypothetical protein
MTQRQRRTDREMYLHDLRVLELALTKRQDPFAWRVFTGQASPEEEQRFREKQEKVLSGGDNETHTEDMGVGREL